jgi:hypothetical protein
MMLVSDLRDITGSVSLNYWKGRVKVRSLAAYRRIICCLYQITLVIEKVNAHL